MIKPELKEEIMKELLDGRLSCFSARLIAERLSLAYSEIGAAADELGIKIKNCELGCF
jgi:molybdate transport system regulatory protein